MKRRLDDATPVHTRIATCERELQLVLDPRRWAKLARAQPMVSVLAHYYYAGLLKNDAPITIKPQWLRLITSTFLEGRSAIRCARHQAGPHLVPPDEWHSQVQRVLQIARETTTSVVLPVVPTRVRRVKQGLQKCTSRGTQNGTE